MTESSDQSDDNAFPTFGCLLGFDYGTKRVGLAVSDPDHWISSPLENYTRISRDVDAAQYKSIIAEYRIVGLVVGLPLHMNGDEGEKALEARSYGAWLNSVTSLPVRFHDERLSSATAEQHLLAAGLTKKKRKQRMDMVAAQILLQSYLDHHSKRSNNG